jgi:AcrR family transcriptional regulator
MARKADPTRKKAIVSAAIAVFSRKGYAVARMADVALAAGIGKGTIYAYFPSKEALFFATFEYLMTQTGMQMQTLAAGETGSAAGRLSAMAEAVLTAWLPRLDVYGLVLEFWSATTTSPQRMQFKTAFQNAYADFRKTVAALIQAGMDSGEFNSRVAAGELAAALIGSWDALLLQAWLDPDFDPLPAARSHMAVVCQGLGTTPDKPEERL